MKIRTNNFLSFWFLCLFSPILLSLLFLYLFSPIFLSLLFFPVLTLVLVYSLYSFIIFYESRVFTFYEVSLSMSNIFFPSLSPSLSRRFLFTDLVLPIECRDGPLVPQDRISLFLKRKYVTDEITSVSRSSIPIPSLSICSSDMNIPYM